MNLQPATQPTFYFVGVTTGQSSIMQVFPAWARHLGISETIKGIDCKWHDDPEVYRAVVSFIKNDPLSLGALVTTHKIDLLSAARSLFDELDPHAQLMGEVSSISKRGGKLIGHAKDPITSGLSLQAFLPPDHWKTTGADLFCIGAGGSAIALTSHLMETCAPDNRPRRIIVSNRSHARLQEIQHIHQTINPEIRTSYHHCPDPEDNDVICSALPPGSLIVNATGLGKDAPGSPLTNDAVFPMNGYAWDFNYRGDLLFLDQARRQEAQRNLHVEDGWIYFLHGWTRVIAEVFDLDIPTSGPEFDRLSEIAASVRVHDNVSSEKIWQTT
jgi:shikimate 5-dehydrogenase